MEFRKNQHDYSNAGGFLPEESSSKPPTKKSEIIMTSRCLYCKH